MFCGFSTFYVTCSISKVLICLNKFNSIHFNSGPYFFMENNQEVAIECHCYCSTLWSFLGMELWRMRQRVTNVCFQQDGATAHTTNQQNDSDLMIWHVYWPTRSLNLKAPDFLLWKCQKTKHMQPKTGSKHYREKRTNNDALLQRIMQNFIPIQQYIKCHRGQLGHIIIKKESTGF